MSRAETHLTTYKIVTRQYLKQYFEKTFSSFQFCCAECWCCKRRQLILQEFENKSFNNSNAIFWNLNENLNNFKIYLL